MKDHRQQSPKELITYWEQQRNKILQELQRRIEADDNPAAFQEQVKARYDAIAGTIHALHQLYQPEIMESLIHRIELTEMGFAPSEAGQMLQRALATA